MKKILLFLATQKGYEVLRYLKCNYREHIGAIVSFDETGMKRNWCDDIERMCDESGFHFFKWKNIRNELIKIIKDHNITGAICVSWRYLLPLELNKYFEDDLIVFHDSLLPKYRGFAPVVTAMICGEKELGASAIFASEGIDTGDVICQRSFPVTGNEYIADIIWKMSGIYVEIADYVFRGMINNTLTGKKQNEYEASYSIWRDDTDYRIDWRLPASVISRFVHAVGEPYMGAMTTDGGKEIRILKCREIEKDMKFMIRDVGKIWNITDNQAVVVCGNGLLCIEEARDASGKRHIFKKLRTKLGGGVNNASIVCHVTLSIPIATCA